jgi:hypothetical protein
MKDIDIDPRIKMRVTSPQGGILQSFVRFVVALCLVIAIFMVTGLFLVRTDGGRDFIKGRAESFLGQTVEIEETRIGWPYHLVLGTLSTEGMEQKRPGLKALEVRIRFVWPLSMRINVHRGVINMVRETDGKWKPESFSRLADLPSHNVSTLSEITEHLRRRVHLEMTDCSLYWLEQSGETIASAQGVAFSLRPVKMPDDDYYHYRLSIYNMTDPTAGQFYDMEREWLASDVQPYIELSRASRREPSAGGGFWEVSK